VRETVTFDELRALAEDWEEQYETVKEESRIEAIYSHATPRQLLDMWATGKDISGSVLTQDQFSSLVENMFRTFGSPPDEQCGSRAEPLTPKEQAAAAKADELAAISDTALLTRKDTARLLGISTDSLDRYARGCEPIGGVVLHPVRPTQRSVRYKAVEVKAVRAGLDEQSRRDLEAKLADRKRYELSRRP
jgi:hypothetical protein